MNTVIEKQDAIPLSITSNMSAKDKVILRGIIKQHLRLGSTADESTLQLIAGQAYAYNEQSYTLDHHVFLSRDFNNQVSYYTTKPEHTAAGVTSLAHRTVHRININKVKQTATIENCDDKIVNIATITGLDYLEYAQYTQLNTTETKSSLTEEKQKFLEKLTKKKIDRDLINKKKQRLQQATTLNNQLVAENSSQQCMLSKNADDELVAFTVENYIQADTLYTHIQNNAFKEWKEDQILNLFAVMTNELKKIHAENYVHRDLTLTNIHLNITDIDNPQVTIRDFDRTVKKGSIGVLEDEVVDIKKQIESLQRFPHKRENARIDLINLRQRNNQPHHDIFDPELPGKGLSPQFHNIFNNWKEDKNAEQQQKIKKFMENFDELCEGDKAFQNCKNVTNMIQQAKSDKPIVVPKKLDYEPTVKNTMQKWSTPTNAVLGAAVGFITGFIAGGFNPVTGIIGAFVGGLVLPATSYTMLEALENHYEQQNKADLALQKAINSEAKIKKTDSCHEPKASARAEPVNGPSSYATISKTVTAHNPKQAHYTNCYYHPFVSEPKSKHTYHIESKLVTSTHSYHDGDDIYQVIPSTAAAAA